MTDRIWAEPASIPAGGDADSGEPQARDVIRLILAVLLLVFLAAVLMAGTHVVEQCGGG